MQGKLRRLSNVWTLTGFQMAQTCCAEGSKYFMVFILSVFTSSQVFWDSKSHHCVTNQTPVITHLDESPDWARSMTSPTGFNKLSVRAQGCKPHSSSHLSSLSLNMSLKIHPQFSSSFFTGSVNRSMQVNHLYLLPGQKAQLKNHS